ncbi:MAG: hypothetical protein COA36_00745 [Desulfotalea sp.]|nr:MAG: hypothetical protein COA36_00745 [Desulfotalea sp.]
MQLEILKNRFLAIVSPSLPNEWEVEDVLAHLLGLSDGNVDSLFQQIAVIWPVSHSLCFAYLQEGAKCIVLMPGDLLGEWSRQILGCYEAGGLLAARNFMADPEKHFLGPLDGRCGARLTSLSERLQLYLCGVFGRRIELGVSKVPTTNIDRVFVPENIDIFTTEADNKLLYKLIVSLQWAHVESRVFEDSLELGHRGDGHVTRWLNTFSRPQEAKELFGVLQFVKSFWLLVDVFPGLIRRATPLCSDLIEAISAQGGSVSYCNMLKSVLQYSVTGLSKSGSNRRYLDDLLKVVLERLRSENTFKVFPEFYAYFDALGGTCNFGGLTLLLGRFDFDAAAVAIISRREDQKNAFIALLSMAVQQNMLVKDVANAENKSQQSDSSALVLTDAVAAEQEQPGHEEFLLQNSNAELSSELKALINSIQDDLGELPQAYVQAAAGMAGKGVNDRESHGAVAGFTQCSVSSVGHSYDEWDYRRGGYRSSWCTLYEKTVEAVTSTFVEDTLLKYQGQLHKIRRQFEMLRNQNRYARRRRDGDEIDFDALVDALGDSKAGIVPSDRLFLRLLRDRREISTYFLVDMSYSTEGWVGTALKESLVLIAEAMAIVGDAYAIYGFSGMRRSKSELFTVKKLDEVYGSVVKQRIAGIGPKEYTRMGPPIRHIAKKMLECESRVRLLIVLSDGKPEDYDDYKGKYAIEDTRKALLEARGAGIHVFCITIDKMAHAYLGHMFGRGQFVFVDSVDTLPTKLVKLYRSLTC